MRIESNKVYFTFTPNCDCEDQEETLSTMADVMDVGLPNCPECGKEMILEKYCEVEIAEGFW